MPGPLSWRLDSNIDSVTLNNTYLKIVKIFNKLLLKTHKVGMPIGFVFIVDLTYNKN